MVEIPGTRRRPPDSHQRRTALERFPLWESAYAEIVFTSRMWPEFGARDLADAVAEFHRRDRRFGAIAGSHSRRTA